MRQLKITDRLTRRSAATDKYLNEIEKFSLLTAEEEAVLAQRIGEGDTAALERLVSANLRFVISVAKQYQYQGLPLGDLINEGNFGLIEAAKRFDATRGFKFISYAVWWIRQRILLALGESSRMIRLPANQIQVLVKASSIEEELSHILERPPTPEEVGERIRLPVGSQDMLLVLRSQGRHESIDTPVSDDSPLTMADQLRDTSSEGPDGRLMAESLRGNLISALSILPDRERKILKRHFGLEGKALTINEIAAELKLGEKGVQNLLRRGLDRLRQNKDVKKLLLS